MRRLLLIRHAKTEPSAPSGRDRDRALVARGRDDAAAMGAFMASKGFLPDLVWMSPATRVQQTWGILGPHLGGAMAQTHEALYGIECEGLLDLVRGAPGSARCLMILAHNPTLHEAALVLTGEGHQEGRRALDQNLPTGALCVIDFSVDDWADVGIRTGRLDTFMSPRLLRESES